jgi:general secretion pathway protein J
MMQPKQKLNAGLTLIELLVALVILALLGLMSWRGIDSALNSRDRIVAVEHRWQKLSRGFALIEHNLLQVAERGSPTPGAFPDFKLEKLPDGQQRLIFWRMDPDQGSRLTGFNLEGDKLMLLRWPHNVPLSDTTGKMEAESILEGVHNVKWAVRTAATQWLDTWPTASGNNVLPSGIRIDMDIDNVGHIQRLFALR